jgi:hypothetical protein
MQNPNPPTRDALRAYIVLIHFLRQVQSLMQDINDEAERFNSLLEQQGEVLDRHRSDIEGLTSALSEYVDDLARVKDIDSSPVPEPKGRRQVGHPHLEGEDDELP